VTAPDGGFRTSQARREYSRRAWITVVSSAGTTDLAGYAETVTFSGGDAMPLATTTSVLRPAGVPGGRVNWVEDLEPGATETEVQLLVLA
jgi:hypothetical protein